MAPDICSSTCGPQNFMKFSKNYLLPIFTDENDNSNFERHLQRVNEVALDRVPSESIIEIWLQYIISV